MTTNEPVSTANKSTANAPAGLASRIWAGNRVIVLLTGLLVVQLALIAFVYWPTAAPQAVGGPLLADLIAEEISRLRIEDQSGQSVTLRREGDGWVIGGTDGYPADSIKADETLTKLLSINTNRLVTRTEGSHARLQVAADTFNRRIILTDANDNDTTLYLGVSAGGASVHVRTEDDNSVYLTQEIAAWETEPFLSGWVSLNYFSVAGSDILALTIRNDQGEIELERDLADQWQLLGPEEDPPLNTGEVSSLVSSLSAINLTDVLGQSPPADFEPDSALVTVEMSVLQPAGENDEAQRETENITLYFDPLPAAETDAQDTAYFVKSSTSDYYVQVSTFLAERLISISAEDLLQTDPLPEDAFELPPEPETSPFELEPPAEEDIGQYEESMIDSDLLEEQSEAAEGSAQGLADEPTGESDVLEDSDADETGATEPEASDPEQGEAEQDEPEEVQTDNN